MYLGSIKENTERRALDFAVPHIEQKIKNHIQYTTIGPRNISVAKNKAQQMIKTKRQSVKVENYGSLYQYLAISISKETNFYVKD